jgi:hypothetical protein
MISCQSRYSPHERIRNIGGAGWKHTQQEASQARPGGGTFAQRFAAIR